METKYGRPKKLVKCARTNLILYLILVESKEEEFDVKYADFIISQVLASSQSSAKLTNQVILILSKFNQLYSNNADRINLPGFHNQTQTRSEVAARCLR